MAFLREFLAFIRERKNYWLIPLFVMLAIFGGLIVMTQGSALAPFIYVFY
jgi:Family of unknown function (DUF5989)